MDFIYPFLSVAAESIGKTIDKLNYNKNKIKPRELLFLLFAAMTVSLLVFAFLAHKPLPVISLELGVLIASMIVISFGQNFFDYVGLSTKNLSLREPINNFEPILASALAYALFPSERNIKYMIAIFVGVIILYLGSADRKLKLTLDKGIIYLFLGVVCSAVLASVYKLGLETVSPTYLLLFRTSGVLLLTQLFFKPSLKSLKNNQIILGVGSGLIYIVANLSKLYSIQYLGLNFTIMVLLLGPGIVYTCSSLVLKEGVQLKQILTSAALLMIIIWAIYL
jgi:drug/metabolite transporter (DMT)-like permease